MTDQHVRTLRSVPLRRQDARPDTRPGTRPGAPAAPTGWALKRRADTRATHASTCTCGARLSACAGCGQERCLACDPYLSDDCRWGL